MNSIKITVAICTYNRSELLEKCLDALVVQTVSKQVFEVIVIDNNSTDNTQKVAKNKSKDFAYFKLIGEEKQGLSHARNRAFQEANTEWIFYLDDDAKAAKDMVEQAIYTIENHDYQFFGGVYYPWYHYGQPRWHKQHMETNAMSYKKVSTLKKGEYVSGGIMIIKKALLEKYRGFNSNIGMIGNKVGYGEETELQIRMRKEDIKIGYNPEIIMYHVVPPYKLDIDWYFKSAFAHGRDNIVTKKSNTSFFFLTIVAFIAIFQVVIYFSIYTPQLIFSKSYFIENWLIDVFKKPTKRVGLIYTGLLQHSRALHKQ